MNYGSVCSGVEAASLAWEHLGWRAKFFAEVEPFPAAVLMHRFGATKPLRPLDPAEASGAKDQKLRESWQRQIAALPDSGTIPNLGDFTKIRNNDYDGNIDLLVGGCPCQSYSFAGLRKGLSDPRGNLSLEFVKLAYRENARWVVFENVPGILSSGDKGSDFAGFLSLLTGWEVPVPKDGWRNAGIVTHAPGCFGVAWRILDAQYTRVSAFPRAVPQRRRRLILVGYLGSWEYPAQVLFDGEMRGGHTPPRRTKGQSSAGGTENGIAEAKSIRMRSGCDGGGKGALIGDNLSHTLATGNDQTIISWGDEKVLPTLDANYPGKINNQDVGKLVVEDSTFWNGADIADTLTCTSHNQLMPDKARLQCVIDMRQIEASGNDVSPTLISTDYKGGKAICYENHATDSRIKEVEVSPTLTSRMGTGGNNTGYVQTVYSFDSLGSNSMKSANPKSGCREVEVAKTMDTSNPDPSKNQGGMAIVGFIKNDAGGEQQGFWNDVFPTVRSQITPAVAIAENIIGRKAENGGNGIGAKEDVSYTLTGFSVGGVAYAEECIPLDLRNATRDPDKHDAVNRQGLGVGKDGDPMTTISASIVPGVGFHATVRKLLPVECERLMGFPDNHTRIPWRGAPEEDCPDAPRYKACGNSMCVNVMMWVGERIQSVEAKIG